MKGNKLTPPGGLATTDHHRWWEKLLLATHRLTLSQGGPSAGVLVEMGGENEPLPLALENFTACEKGCDSATGGSTCILPIADRPLGGLGVVRSLVPPPWWGRGKGSASPGLRRLVRTVLTSFCGAVLFVGGLGPEGCRAGKQDVQVPVVGF